MLWGGRWEGGSCMGTHVRIKDFKIKKKKKVLVNHRLKKKKNKVLPLGVRYGNSMECGKIM